MFFANKQTEPEITSTLIQNRIEQASDLSKANVEINDSTIHVTVDKPTVISNSIDESSIEVYDETKNIFNPISVSDFEPLITEVTRFLGTGFF